MEVLARADPQRKANFDYLVRLNRAAETIWKPNLIINRRTLRKANEISCLDPLGLYLI